MDLEDFEKVLSRNKKLIGVILAALILFYLASSGALYKLGIIPGPEGVDCSVYSVVAGGGIRVGDRTETLDQGVGVPSVIGKVSPGTWIAYKDYVESPTYFAHYPRRIGYRWVRPDPKTPVIEAVIVDRDSGKTLDGVTLQVRIQRPTFDQINTHGDPLGRNPTQIDWYSFNTENKTAGNTVTWKHYEVYVVPVDFVIELSVRPVTDRYVGDFQSFDLWFVLDTVVWLNAFTADQYKLLKEKPANVTVTAYNFRGAFPIWAWVGAWDPWVVSGRDGNPDKFYDPADLTPEEHSDLNQHLQIQPSFTGSEVSLYTKPGYVYERIFASDIIKNPDKLKNMIASSIPGLPDPRFAQTVYFPLTLVNYGALKRSGGWWVTYWEKQYYPTSYMRVRALYAVYGEWVYAWTKQEAEKQGYRWENRSSEISGSKSEWDKFFGGLGAWFTSPWTLLWTGIFGFFAILIVLVVLAIFAPGFLSALGGRRRKE